jgi:hypothetical protein
MSMYQDSFELSKPEASLSNYSLEQITNIKRLIISFIENKKLVKQCDLPFLKDLSNIIITEIDRGHSLCIKIRIRGLANTSGDNVVVLKIYTEDILEGDPYTCGCSQLEVIAQKKSPLSNIIKSGLD